MFVLNAICAEYVLVACCYWQTGGGDRWGGLAQTLLGTSSQAEEEADMLEFAEEGVQRVRERNELLAEQCNQAAAGALEGGAPVLFLETYTVC